MKGPGKDREERGPPAGRVVQVYTGSEPVDRGYRYEKRGGKSKTLNEPLYTRDAIVI